MITLKFRGKEKYEAERAIYIARDHAEYFPETRYKTSEALVILQFPEDELESWRELFTGMFEEAEDADYDQKRIDALDDILTRLVELDEEEELSDAKEQRKSLFDILGKAETESPKDETEDEEPETEILRPEPTKEEKESLDNTLENWMDDTEKKLDQPEPQEKP